jgi:hypothetical protein
VHDSEIGDRRIGSDSVRQFDPLGQPLAGLGQVL